MDVKRFWRNTDLIPYQKKFWILICVVLWHMAPASAQLQSRNLDLSREAQLRYNRVEGLFVGYSLRASPTQARHVTATFGGGYGLQSDGFRWDMRLQIDKSRWSASAGLFDRTTSPNESIVRTPENTLFALLFKGDYRDYFRTRNGFEVDFRYKSTRFLSLVAFLSAYQYQSMSSEVNWSVFRSGDSFRPNPGIREGDAAIFKMGILYNNRRRSPIFRNAWVTSVLYERGFREFPYDGLSIAFKRYQKTILGRQAFVARGLVGTRVSTDEQHLYDLGGISTLRGYRIKEYTGNRVLLFNIDYLFRGDLIGKLSGKLGQFVELVAFADAGWVSQVSKQTTLLKGFGSLRAGDIKTNVGGALSLYRQLIRFNVARRFDGDIDDWTFSVRFKREF